MISFLYEWSHSLLLSVLSPHLRPYILPPNFSPLAFSWNQLRIFYHYCSFCLTPELPFISSYQFLATSFSLSALNVKVKFSSSIYELPAKLSLPVLFLAKSPSLYYYKPWSRKIKPVFQLVYEASSSLPISLVLIQGHYFQLEYETKWSSVPCFPCPFPVHGFTVIRNALSDFFVLRFPFP